MTDHIRPLIAGNWKMNGLKASTAEFEAMLAAQTALGRVGEPQDVARVIAMLLSEEGGWINAQTIEVAGGYNI